MRSMGYNIEVFTAGCPLCRETIEIIEKAMCPECRLTEYNILQEEASATKAEEYGIRSVPTTVVNGDIKIEGKPTLELVKRILGT